MDPAESLSDKKKIDVLDELSGPDGPMKLLALEQKLYLYMKIITHFQIIMILN